MGPHHRQHQEHPERSQPPADGSSSSERSRGQPQHEQPAQREQPYPHVDCSQQASVCHQFAGAAVPVYALAWNPAPVLYSPFPMYPAAVYPVASSSLDHPSQPVYYPAVYPVYSPQHAQMMQQQQYAMHYPAAVSAPVGRRSEAVPSCRPARWRSSRQHKQQQQRAATAGPSDSSPPHDGAREAAGSTDDSSGEASTSQSVDENEERTSWAFLTAGILQMLLGKLGDTEAKTLRLVCRHWRGVVDHDIESLSPNMMASRQLVKLFPNLKTLNLTNCPFVRNKDLMIISTSGLNLHTLTLGDDKLKPWVTNSGLEHIAHITSLTSLNLHDCLNVTNAGIMWLTSLQCLSSLSLRGCRKLTNAGLEALQQHTALTSLNLYGCLKIADKGILALSHLQLVSLHLGNTKVKDEGLAYLAQITTLQELHFDMENLTDAGVSLLSSLTRLESLALRDCGEVSGDSLSLLVPALPNLMSLDLYKNITMDDSQLSRCLEFLGAVTFLDLRGTPVTEDGLQELTKLTSLQKLCLAPTKDDLWSQYLCVVSNLTQLTSLNINNCTLISFGQLETLRQLKLLRELDLSHSSKEEEGCTQLVNPSAINAMAAITSLTSIDLSRRPMHEEHLEVLAERLPRLNTLIIVGCPVLYSEVQSLQRRFPELIIHRKPLFDISCSSSDHGNG